MSAIAIESVLRIHLKHRHHSIRTHDAALALISKTIAALRAARAA